jgi:predicted  nucleic acid-binding Zn-ribbon protein
VLLRPQKWNEVKSGNDVLTCDTCGRILFYDPAHEPAPPEPEKKRSRKAKKETQVEAQPESDDGSEATREAAQIEVPADRAS